jgi:predicted TIM-barrel enzyme
MGYPLEVKLIEAAHRLDMLTTPYVFNPTEARWMTEAGADIVVAHMGLTTSGSIGARTALTLADCVDRTGEIVEACKSLRPDTLVLCHGGPIAMPEDVRQMLAAIPQLDGFYGASSMERLPTEVAIRQQTRSFVELRRP